LRLQRRLVQAIPAGVAFECEPAPMERRERRAVADRNDRRIRQPLLDEPVQRRLRRLVERGRGFIEE
jgi:hypothetical protein